MLVLILYPFMELMSLLFLSEKVGLGSAFLYVLFTFIIGANLIRSAAGGEGRSPGVLTDGREAPFRLMAGFLLLIPGLLSDGMALLILIPAIRRIVWTHLVQRFLRGNIRGGVWTYTTGPKGDFMKEARFDTLDTEAERVERDVTPPSLKDPNK